MKITLLFFTVLIFGGCASPKMFSIDKYSPRELEPGKWYSSVKTDTFQHKSQTFQEGFVLRITEPVFKKNKRNISKKVADLYEVDEKHYRIPVRRSSVKYTILNNELEYELQGDYDAGIVFRLLEVPPGYRSFTPDLLEKQNFEIEFLELIQPSKLEKIFVKKKPKKLKPNEWYFKPGYWSELREYLTASRHPPTPQYLEEKLVEAGYELEIDSVFGENDKEALIDFQKKNDIPEYLIGSYWNKETLRKLGIYRKIGTIKNMPYYEQPEKAFIIKD